VESLIPSQINPGHRQNAHLWHIFAAESWRWYPIMVCNTRAPA
jgi:hypothetical protein